MSFTADAHPIHIDEVTFEILGRQRSAGAHATAGTISGRHEAS
jgi:hypothetical protein